MAPIPLRLRRSAPPGRAGGAPAPCAADKGEVPVEAQDIAERSLVNPPPCLPSTRRSADAEPIGRELDSAMPPWAGLGIDRGSGERPRFLLRFP